MANNPLYVVSGGAWRASNKSYVWTGGRWYRIHGAWAYTALPGRNSAWYPVFEYGPIDLPPPTGMRGVTGTHTTATFAWNAVTDPFSEGYRMHLRYGRDKSGGIIWTHPSDGSLLPVSQTSFKWEGLVPDNTYHFTIQSFDEFGKAGPESNGITFMTGHTRLTATNPSGTGSSDSVFVTPVAAPTAVWGTKTYLDGKDKWIESNDEVRQGRSAANPGQGDQRGCVRYGSSIHGQINDYFKNGWGLNPPRGSITVHDATIRRVTRLKVSLNTGTVKIFTSPAEINFHDRPVRHGEDESWFNSPAPNDAKTDIHLDDANALKRWAQHWEDGADSHNGIMIFNNNPGTANNDGTHYCVFSRAEGNNWQLQLWVTFEYESRALEPARWV